MNTHILENTTQTTKQLWNLNFYNVTDHKSFMVFDVCEGYLPSYYL